MILAKKIKIEVSAEDARTLEFMQGKCRGLYNWWVMRLRDGEKWPGWKVAKASLQESKKHDPELNDVYGKLLQEVFFRLDDAMKAFFRRLKNGEKPGFPRVRPRHNFFTLCYPAMYIKIEGKSIRLPTGGKGKNKQYPDIIATLTEEAPEVFKTVAISRDGRGNYYASFPTEVEEVTLEENEREDKPEILAIDLGIKTLATGINEQGRVYHIGGFNKGKRWYNKQLDKIRSKRDKCKKKSRRYIRLSKTYKRVSEKKQNKQKDSLHKASNLISHKLVERTVVVGDLSQRQMVTREHVERNKNLNRSVYNDWGLYGFLQMLIYKCKKNGKDLVIIDERNTSKMCSGCGNLQKMPLHKRTYCCPVCGMVMDRDENSSVNILARYMTPLALGELHRYLARLGPPTSMEKASMEKHGVLHDGNDDVGIAVIPHFPIVQQLRLWK
jgi:putative transposase